MNTEFALYSNCIPVKGQRRSLIVDLQNRRYFFIPNDLQYILTKQPFTLSEIIDEFGEENLHTINQYIEFLMTNDLINLQSPKNQLTGFVSFNLDWKFSSHITNLLIDINSDTNVSQLNTILLECSEILLCEFIQIRIFELQNDINILDLLINLFKNTENSIIRSIEIYIPYSEKYSMKMLERFAMKNFRITKIIIHSIPIIKTHLEKYKNIFTTHTRISDSSHCGYISYKNFEVNIPLFTEAQQHNTCLNRKISIDVNGEIKNCPSMAKSYGNIKDTTLAEAIEKPGFKDLWFINKDKIHVCKDCEFRYICTDCRAYIENPEDIYSKPLKCGYNPYTAEWEEWSTNPLKQKAIEYYGMQELVKKEK
jgi:SPASM domain peptide maturase of grasp-with-spasm system